MTPRYDQEVIKIVMMTNKKFTAEIYILIMFLLVLMLLLQISPGRSLVPFLESVRLLLIVGLAVLSLVATDFNSQKFSTSQLVSMFILTSFFLWAIFTSFFSDEYVMDSLRRSFLAVGTSLIILFSVFILQPSESLVWRLASVFVMVASVVALLGLLMSFYGGSYTGSGHGTYFQSLRLWGLDLTHEVHVSGGFPRISSITPNPNTLGFFSGLACLIIFIRHLIGRSRFFPSLFFFTLNLAALVHSFSRGSIVALFLALVLAVWLHSKKRFVLYSMAGVFVLIVTLPAYIEPLTAMGEAREGQGLQGRELIWANTLEVFNKHPLAGVGFGLETECIHEPAGIVWTMHNAYLVVLSETGIVGFVFFATFLLTVLVALIRGLVRTKDRGLQNLLVLILGVVFFIMMRSMVETSIMRFTDVNIIFILFVAIGLVAAQKISREEGEISSS